MSAHPWHAEKLYSGPRSWVVWRLFLGTHYIVHKKGNGRERRFNSRLDADAFARYLNAR